MAVCGDKIKFRNRKQMCDFNSGENYEAEWVARCVYYYNKGSYEPPTTASCGLKR